MTDDLKGYSYCRDYLPGGIPTSRYYRDPKGDRIDDPNMIERLDALFSDRIEKEKGIQEANEEPNDLLTQGNRTTSTQGTNTANANLLLDGFAII